MIPASTQDGPMRGRSNTSEEELLEKNPIQETESEAIQAYVNSYRDEEYTKLLGNVIPKIQTKRARAYAMFQRALRHSRSSDHEQLHKEKPKDPFTTFAAVSTDGPAIENYPAVCAHVTEELKLCSEGIMTLRVVVKNRVDRNAEDKDGKMIVKWLDQLQKLEEDKLYTTVAMHTISRSASARIQGMNEDNTREKYSKYAKQLQSIDDDINELLEEVKEFYVDELLEGDD